MGKSSTAIFFIGLIVTIGIFCLVPIECPTCKGSGVIIVYNEGPFGIPIPELAECPTCRGTGKVPMIIFLIEWFKG